MMKETVYADEAADAFFECAISELRKHYCVAEDDVVMKCSWPVQPLHHPRVSGVHAVCHALALLFRDAP